jgi:hypothetical protein
VVTSLFCQVPNLVDLNQGFACGQQLFGARPTPDDEIFEGRIITISAGDPDNYWRRSTALQDLNEVIVLGNDYGRLLPSLLEDLRVFGLEKAEIGEMDGAALTYVAQPLCESRGKLVLPGFGGQFWLGGPELLLEV